MASSKKVKKPSKKTKSAKTSKVSSVPKKKITKPTKTKSKTANLAVVKKKNNQKFYDELKLSESYVSLILGAAVVMGIFVIFFAYVHESRNAVATEKVLHDSISPTPASVKGKEYVMQENESLWDLAVRFYGDGFAYPKIVEANKGVITNPDYVPPGTKIIIPPAQQ